MTEKLTPRIIEEALPLLGKSPSHGLSHVLAVLKFGRLLIEHYGGDAENFEDAGGTHDLCRSDPQLNQQQHREYSARLASQVLQNVGFPTHKIPAVTLCIMEHDQPDQSPSTVEGKILKDADFLAGMGALAIMRTILWTHESEPDEFPQKIFERLSIKLPKRVAGLEFEESKLLAASLNRIVTEFLAQLTTYYLSTDLP